MSFNRNFMKTRCREVYFKKSIRKKKQNQELSSFLITKLLPILRPKNVNVQFFFFNCRVLHDPVHFYVCVYETKKLITVQTVFCPPTASLNRSDGNFPSDCHFLLLLISGTQRSGWDMSCVVLPYKNKKLYKELSNI